MLPVSSLEATLQQSLVFGFPVNLYVYKYWIIHTGHVYIYIPRTRMTSIFEGQPPKTRPFPIKTRVIWVLGTLYILGVFYIYIYIHESIIHPFPHF